MSLDNAITEIKKLDAVELLDGYLEIDAIRKNGGKLTRMIKRAKARGLSHEELAQALKAGLITGLQKELAAETG